VLTPSTSFLLANPPFFPPPPLLVLVTFLTLFLIGPLFSCFVPTNDAFAFFWAVCPFSCRPFSCLFSCLHLPVSTLGVSSTLTPPFFLILKLHPAGEVLFFCLPLPYVVLFCFLFRASFLYPLSLSPTNRTQSRLDWFHFVKVSAPQS